MEGKRRKNEMKNIKFYSKMHFKRRNTTVGKKERQKEKKRKNDIKERKNIEFY